MKRQRLRVITAIALCGLFSTPSIGNESEVIQLEQKVLLRPNPLSHEFDATVESVKAGVKTAVEEWERTQMRKYRTAVWRGTGSKKVKESLTATLRHSATLSTLFWKGNGDPLSKNLLTKPGNENDAYLYGDISPFGESAVYFKDHQPVICYADFHIHLSAVEPGKTRVEITAYRSRVVTGLDTSWQAHGPSLIFVLVPATTVEEYEILLAIGAELGAKNMPKLEIPAPDGPSKSLKLPRTR
jgi:hypothetical protein